MADKRTYYVICEDNCKFESMTKEQILAAIEQAVSEGEIKDVDTGFVTKLQELNKKGALKFWVGTAAEFNALADQEEDVFYIVTDSTEGSDIESAIEDLRSDVDVLENKFNKTLWTGTFKNTDTTPFTVEGFENYSLFAITVNGHVYLSYRNTNNNTLEGNYFYRAYSSSKDTDIQYNHYVAVNYSGNQITAVEANEESSNLPIRTAKLTKIVGIL